MSAEKELVQSYIQGKRRVSKDIKLYSAKSTTASTANTLTFFQDTVGSVTERYTNMKQAGQLEAGQHCLITKISCKIYNNDGASFFLIGTGAGPAVNYPLNIMAALGYWNFKVGSQTEYEGHMLQFFEPIDKAEDAPASKLLTAVIPNALQRRELKLKKPIIIPSGTSFSLNANITTPSASGGYSASTTYIMFMLEGVAFMLE